MGTRDDTGWDPAAPTAERRARSGAAVGKLGGTIAKLATGIVMWGLSVRAAFVL